MAEERASAQKITTPTAILVGSVVVALGLYWGLRASGTADEPTAAAGPSAPGGEPLPAATRSAPGPRPSTEKLPGLQASSATSGDRLPLRSQVELAATQALESKRAAWVKACWDPSFAKNPEPSKAQYILDMTFDATGKEISRGINEVRGYERGDTAMCLREQPMDLTIDPPGANVRVRLELALP